jgi:hypothetical protein
VTAIHEPAARTGLGEHTGTERAEARTAPVRVAISVWPPLLADTLRALLDHDGLTVVVHASPPDKARWSVVDHHADVAIVSSSETRSLAPTVITLDDAATSVGGGRVTAAHGRSRDLPDLDAVLAEVRSHIDPAHPA